MFGSRPHVHAGFLQSWHANGLNQKLLKRIQNIIDDSTVSEATPQLTVYVTGDPISAIV